MTTFPTRRLSRLLPVVAALAAVMLGACSAHGGGAPGAIGEPGTGDGGGATSGVAIQPATADVAPGATVRFAATADGAAHEVTWSVSDGAITADGVYTAPAAPGVYTVVATSAQDAARSASATVTVAAPAANVANVRDYGAVGDGVADDTAAFQRAAAAGKDLLVPRPASFYKITGTVSISTSIRGDGSLPEIRMSGTDGQESHAMLAILNYAGPGLTVSGLHLNGGWDQVTTSGEWAHNIMVKGSQNVTIQDNVLEAPEGDNVLIGGENNPSPSKNVVVQNNQLLTPRRCAVALIWVDGVTITGNTIQKPSTYVTAIDAEPNPNGHETDWNVTITNNHFDTAAGAVMVYNMPSNAPPGGIGGNFTISGNRGTAAFFFTQVNGGSTWVNLNRTDNF